MSFVEYADSIRAKAHMGQARVPVLVGATALIVVALGFAAAVAFGACSSSSFELQKADGNESQVSASEEGAASSETEQAAAIIVVHVAGAVAQPGVVELAEGARVQDAVDAAGGFAEGASTDSLNLARVLTDGEQIVVTTEEAEQAVAASDASGETSASAADSGKVNINTATEAELDTLPGVGPSTAQKIIADREANGPFATIEDLKRVSGIGDKKYANLADSICV